MTRTSSVMSNAISFLNDSDIPLMLIGFVGASSMEEMAVSGPRRVTDNGLAMVFATM